MPTYYYIGEYATSNLHVICCDGSSKEPYTGWYNSVISIEAFLNRLRTAVYLKYLKGECMTAKYFKVGLYVDIKEYTLVEHINYKDFYKHIGGKYKNKKDINKLLTKGV